jgi:hypothetical protein
MLKPITAAALGLALMGCNLPDPAEGLSPAQKARCDYEAQLATAGIYSGIAAGYQAGMLKDRCYQLRQMENRERQPPVNVSVPTSNRQFSMNCATFLGGLAEGCGGVSSAQLQRYRSSVTAVTDGPEWNMGRASATRADAEQCAAARRRVLDRPRTQ